jgi:hypothetical protein
MGKSSDRNAVVDSNGLVLGGVKGLRVVDASIIPILPPGQPMATVCKFLDSPKTYVLPSIIVQGINISNRRNSRKARGGNTLYSII